MYCIQICNRYHASARNYRTEKIIIIEQKNNYRTGSESARNRDPEEYEGTVFYRTFVLLIPFYNSGTDCILGIII